MIIVGLFHLNLCIIHVLSCMKIVPQSTVGIPVATVQNYKKDVLTKSSKSDMIFKTASSVDNEVNNMVSKTSQDFENKKELKEFSSLLSSCQLHQIKFHPPKSREEQEKRKIIPPEIKCKKHTLFGCEEAQVKCKIPEKSKFPLISGFAKINNADWATTDLTASEATFNLTCDVYNRWIYVSDIPGIEGKIFPTNEVFCILVPILSENTPDDYFYYYS